MIDLDAARAGIRARLDELAKLEPGWFDGDGVGFDPVAMAVLAGYLCALLERLPVKQHIYPTPEGHVRVEWSFPGKVSVSSGKVSLSGAEVSADFRLSSGLVLLQGVWLATDRDAELCVAWTEQSLRRVAAFVSQFKPCEAP